MLWTTSSSQEQDWEEGSEILIWRSWEELGGSVSSWFIGGWITYIGVTWDTALGINPGNLTHKHIQLRIVRITTINNNSNKH